MEKTREREVLRSCPHMKHTYMFHAKIMFEYMRGDKYTLAIGASKPSSISFTQLARDKTKQVTEPRAITFFIHIYVYSLKGKKKRKKNKNKF
jgi:hypothetical protein